MRYSLVTASVLKLEKEKMDNVGNGFNSVLAMMWLVLGMLVACYACLWFYSRYIEKPKTKIKTVEVRADEEVIDQR